MAPTAVHCGLCGTAFSRPYFISINPDAEKGPGPGQPNIEDTEWLNDARILYRSTEFSRTFRRFVWLSIFSGILTNQLRTERTCHQLLLSATMGNSK